MLNQNKTSKTPVNQTESNPTTPSNKKVGRKTISISYPQGKFTVDQLATSLNSVTKFISKTSLQQKINEAVKMNQLFKVGKEEKDSKIMGRKRVIYSTEMAN